MLFVKTLAQIPRKFSRGCDDLALDLDLDSALAGRPRGLIVRDKAREVVRDLDSALAGRPRGLLVALTAEILRQPRRDHLASVLQLLSDRAPPRSAARTRLNGADWATRRQLSSLSLG